MLNITSEKLAEILQENCCIAARDFQLAHGLDLIHGRDLFLVAAPGFGKTLVMAAPFLAAQHLGQNGIGIVVVPSDILSEQQAEAFRSYNLFALAINRTTLRHAQYDKRDLVKEITGGTGVRIAVVTPGMLKDDNLQRMWSQDRTCIQICWLFIDDVHLANKNDSSVWQASYRAILHMRDRLPYHTIWAGMTSTATPLEIQEIAQSLGFRSFTNARYPVDRKNVKFIPRFLEHPVSGTQYLDLSFLIPASMKSATDIRPTLIFCDTLEISHCVMLFLDSLIPLDIPNRTRLIMPFNGLMDLKEFNDFKARMDSGAIRIGVVTDDYAYSYNISATRVVTFSLSGSLVYSKLCKQWGRVSRDGSLGVVYAFVPSWLRILPPDQVITDKEREEARRRDDVPKIILDFFNATLSSCPRDLQLAHNDEALGSRPEHCCSVHNPDPEESADRELVAQWVQRLPKPVAARKPAPWTDGTFKSLEPHMKKSLGRTLDRWRILRWQAVRPPNNDDTSSMFLSSQLVSRLCDRAHVCTTMAKLEKILDSQWPYFETEGEALYRLITVAVQGFKETVAT